MAQRDVSSIELRRPTIERLKRYREELQALAEAGRLELPESGRPGGGPPSLDWVVNRLLDNVEEHRKRARKARRKTPPS